MLRFLPFYFTFLAVLCLPVRTGFAQSSALSPAISAPDWEENSGATGSGWLGMETCFKMSEAEKAKILAGVPPNDPNASYRTNSVRANRNGLFERQCAQLLNALVGTAELSVGARPVLRLTRDAFRSRTNDFMRREQWEDFRIHSESSIFGETRLQVERRLQASQPEAQPAADSGKKTEPGKDSVLRVEGRRRLRTRGMTDEEAIRITEKYFDTLRTKRVILTLDPQEFWQRREIDGPKTFRYGTIIEVEVNNASINSISGADQAALPEYVLDSVRNLSRDAVREFNSRIEGTNWSKLVSASPKSRTYWFFRGLEDRLRGEEHVLGSELNVGRGLSIEERTSFVQAYGEGARFVRSPKEFEFLLKHATERISVDAARAVQQNLPGILQDAVKGRVMTGEVGPRRATFRTLTDLGMVLLVADGLINYYVFLSNIKNAGEDPNGDFCRAMYCTNYHGFKLGATVLTPAGLLEVLHSAGFRDDHTTQTTGE